MTWAVSVGLLMVTAARGGDYHNPPYLICSDCHTMHYSLQHDYSGGAPPTLGGGGPFRYLLRWDGNALCTSCHDGQTFAPDVVGSHVNGYVRQAGGTTTGATPYDNWKGHTLSNQYVTPPGGTSRMALACGSCHDPHGNANYRNLGGTVPVTYAKGTNDTTKDVFERKYYGDNVSSMAERYSVDNVDFNEPNTQQSAMGRFCRGCHTDFHGQKGDSNMGGNGTGGTEWLRHPTADANIGAVGGGHSSLTTFSSRFYRVKVMSPTGNWGTQGQAWANAPTDLTPTCITCHKAHGNQNPFGLIYMAGTGPITEEGDAEGNGPPSAGGGARKLCKQCHVQGGST